MQLVPFKPLVEIGSVNWFIIHIPFFVGNKYLIHTPLCCLHNTRVFDGLEPG